MSSSTSGEAPEASSRLSPLARVIIAATGTRLLVLGVAFATVAVVGIHGVPMSLRFPSGAETLSGWLGDLVNPWAHYDGVWFIRIASRGYASTDGSTAFFPLFPLMLKYLGMVLGNLVVTGIVISTACYAVSVWLLYRIVSSDFDRETTSRAAVYLCVGSFSFFFQAVYTESLFLALTLACFVLAREHRWVLAGLVAALAALTRSTGVLLLIPMAIYYYESRDWSIRRTDRHAAGLILVPVGLLLWIAYLGLRFGKPLLFAESQGQWHRQLAAPNFTVARGVQAAAGGLLQLLSMQSERLFWNAQTHRGSFDLAVTNIVALGCFTIAGLLLWYGARRLPRAYWWFALASLAYPLCFPSSFSPLKSYPRLALVVFPLYVCLALFPRCRPRLHRAAVVAGLILLVVFTAKFALFSWVA